ncbi:MAG TPA: hypothetical protein VMF03_10385 [Steroidobacteraceae bacterium]|nr:hypothetical protein [Steroidobacteraceae bacterium]
MFKKIVSILGTQRQEPVRKPAARPQPKPAVAASPYGAVSVTPGIRSCPAARGSVGQRHLSRVAPRLPLPTCTMPAQCACRFKKVPDRRDGDRRQIGITETGRWFSGAEKRSGGRRKAAKKP